MERLALSDNATSRCIFGGYLLFLAALYRRPYATMTGVWQGENYSYCVLVPLILLYLLWEKRRELQGVPSVPSWFGLTLILPGLGLYWLGELGGEYYTVYFSSWLLVVGLCWLHLGRHKVRMLAFPLCLSLAMFPLPHVIFSNTSVELKLLSSRLGVRLLQLVGIASYREGNVIDLGFTRLQVVDACSGLRYLLPLLILALLLARYFRAPLWQRCLLVVSAVPLTILTNSLRIAFVGLLYRFGGAPIAEGFFHDFSGWLIFMVSLLLLLGEIRLFRRYCPPGEVTREGAEATAPATTNPGRQPSSRRGCGLVQFALVAVMLGATLVLSQTLQFREKVPLTRPLNQFPLDLGGWQGTRSGLEQKYLDELKLSDYLLVDYRNAGGQGVALYVAYNDSQRQGASSHSPASCLPGGGWIFQESGSAVLPGHPSVGGEFEVKRALVQKNGERMLVYYWFPQRGRVLTGMAQLKFYLFWDALTRRRTDGGLVRLITPVYETEETEKAEARLAAFSGQILPLLREFIPD